MSKLTQADVSKETFKEWLHRIFSLCDVSDLEEVMDYQEEDDGVVDYAVDYYLDDLYPKIFDHFEYKPYMTGHDEYGNKFFEHSYLYGDVLELDYSMNESCSDGFAEYDLYDEYYLVSTGEIYHCKSFRFKSTNVEFTHEYAIGPAVEGEDYLDALNVILKIQDIIMGKE